MFNLFKKHHYISVIEVNPKLFSNSKLIDVKLVKKIKWLYFFKFKRIKYFEVLTISGKAFLVFGTTDASSGKVNRNVFIFMTELVNEIKTHGKHKVSKDFPYTIKKYKEYKIKTYKIKHFNFVEEYKKIKI